MPNEFDQIDSNVIDRAFILCYFISLKQCLKSNIKWSQKGK